MHVDSLGEGFNEEFNHDHSCTVMSKDDIKIKQHSRPDHTYNIFKTFAELINIHRKSKHYVIDKLIDKFILNLGRKSDKSLGYKMVEEENYHEIYQKKLIR